MTKLHWNGRPLFPGSAWHLVHRPETLYETNLLFNLLELYIEQDTPLPDELKRRFVDFVRNKIPSGAAQILCAQFHGCDAS
jgi:hypothetical protein